MIFWSALAISTVAQAEDLTLQTDHALALHLSNAGLEQIGTAIQQIVPSTISIGAGQGTLECSSSTTLTYDLDAWDLNLSLDNLDFETQEDSLTLTIYGHLASSQVQVGLVGDCTVFEDLNEQCSLALPTTPFSLSMAIEMRLENGEFVVQADEPNFSISPITNPVGDCLVADAVDTILGQNPTVMSDIITDAILPELDSIPASVEQSLNGVIEELTITEAVDLLGTNMDVTLSPTAVFLETTGIVLGFGSEVTVPVDESCADITAFDAPTQVAWPDFNGLIFNTVMHYDAGLFVSRHFVEQALYGVWASGALCIDVGELSGLDFTGEFAGNFFGDEMVEVIGSNQVDLQLMPQAPFTVAFSDDQPPLSLVIDDLSLEGYGDVLHRRTRLLQVNIDSEVGIGLNLEENSLYTEVPITTDDFFLEEGYREIFSPGYSDGVPALLELALNNFLQEDFPVIRLPVILGVELDQIIWDHDADQEWLGAHILLNTTDIEPFALPGCSASDIGCDSGGPQIDIDIEEVLGCNDVQVGCEGGCAQQGRIRVPAGRILGLMMIFFMALLRRRE